MVKVTMEGEKSQQIQPIKRIENNKAASKIFKRRKDCIKKKTMELATLCGIKACTVLFGPNGEVETWPEEPSDVKAIIKMFKEYGKDRLGKRVLLQPSEVLGEKIKAVEEETEAVKKDNLKKAFSGWSDHWLHGLSKESLTSFLRLVELKLQVLTARIEFLKMVNEQSNEKGKAIVSPYWFGMHEMDNFERVSNIYPLPLQSSLVGNSFGTMHVIDDPYQLPLQTVEPTGGGYYSYNPMFAVDAEAGSVPMVWPLNYYGDIGSSSNCGGSGGGGVNNYSNQLFLPQPSPLQEVLQLASMYGKPPETVAPQFGGGNVRE